MIVEHDLAVCDYLSDFVHVLYGEPGVYGIVSHIHGVREGINRYLDGFLPDENMIMVSVDLRQADARVVGYEANEKRMIEKKLEYMSIMIMKK